jgi:hypothetical protein
VGDRAGEDALADALDGCDGDEANVAGGDAGDFAVRGLCFREHLVGVDEQRPAGLGELCGTPPARLADDEGSADDLFERPQLVAHGRLRALSTGFVCSSRLRVIRRSRAGCLRCP